MVFGRLQKRVKSLFGGDLQLEQLAAEKRQQREALDLNAQEFFSLFRPSTAELEASRQAALSERLSEAALAFSEHFLRRHRPQVYVHPSQSDKLVTLYREQPEGWKQMVTSAERAVAHEFCPLGSEPFQFPSAIDWFSDFGGNSWYFGHVEELREKLKRDSQGGLRPVELTWEFNELGHLVDMARVYWVTGRETLVGEFLVQTADWAERNPALGGINWLASSTIAARAINWMLAFNYFLKSPQLKGNPTARLTKQLVLHAALMAELLDEAEVAERLALGSALATLCLALPELVCAQRWYEKAISEMVRGATQELDEQGFHRSGASSSHRQALEWLLLPLMMSELNGLPTSPELTSVTTRSLKALSLLNPPGGPTPDLGTPRSNRFFGRHQSAGEQTRILLATGSVLMGQIAPLGQSCPSELLWWFGPSALARWAEMNTSQDLPLTGHSTQAGLAVARESWEPKASWVLLRGRPHSLDAHLRPTTPAVIETHDDHLGLSLNLEGESVLLEPGGPAQPGTVKQAFSSLAAHSAPRIAREREPLSLSRQYAGPLPEIKVKKVPQGTYMGCSRPAWLMPDRPWHLQREILFMPETKHVAIRDQVLGEGEIQFESSLLLSPRLDVLMRGDMGCLLRGKSLQARIVPIFPARFRYELKRGCPNPFSGWVWGSNGQARPAHRLLYFTRLEGPFTVYLWLVWDPNDTKVPRTEELDRLFDQA